MFVFWNVNVVVDVCCLCIVVYCVMRVMLYFEIRISAHITHITCMIYNSNIQQTQTTAVAVVVLFFMTQGCIWKWEKNETFCCTCK